MWHVPGKLHNISLRFLRCLLHLSLLLPPKPRLTWKILYSIGLFSYILFIFQWRIALNYNVMYDVINDDVSRFLDLVNFVFLVVGHTVVALELLWKNHSKRIEQQLQQIRHILRIQFGHKMNLQRIETYCNVIYRILFMRVFIFLLVTLINCITNQPSLLVICHFYSEVVLTLRCFEFSLYSTLVMGFYKELIEVGHKTIKKLGNPIISLESRHNSPLQRLSTLQQLHQQLWQIHRDIENNFEGSLFVVMMKSFVDTSVMPYWVYLNSTRENIMVMQLYCITEEFAKLLEICIPCWICASCNLLQNKFRSLFYGVYTNRQNQQLNADLFRILTQLGQERSQFSVGGYLSINNKTLAKFLFATISYFMICIQFRLTFSEKNQDKNSPNIDMLCQNVTQ